MDRARPRLGGGMSLGIPAVLLVLAALGWWWSARMVDDMSMGSMAGMESMPGMDMDMDGMQAGDVMSFGAFLVAWVAMMAAMMFPAISPVVKLYARAAAGGRVAPLPFFVFGYIVVWGAVGLPSYFAWRWLMDPIADAEPWAARLAGVVLIAAAVWQLTPLKSICLRHCRSPISFFLHAHGDVRKPSGALRLGVHHGLFCLGCCWALMAVLVAVGTMNLAWMAGLALLILLEKNAPAGERVAQVAAVAFVGFALALLLRPETLTALT